MEEKGGEGNEGGKRGEERGGEWETQGWFGKGKAGGWSVEVEGCEGKGSEKRGSE